ncbi:MAG TPA: carbamate kinase [Chloroflexota bacterium]|nr:carbamate kinase [Chloroflexota bacterium]
MDGIVVVAYGGNAILPSGSRGTLEEQWVNVRRMSEQVCDLAVSGRRLVIVHGNGPQVGDLLLRSELTASQLPPVTLDVAGAMSQGQLGYMLQLEIGNGVRRKGSSLSVASVVTQSVVSGDDPAFRVPTKPIGRFYSPAEAEKLRGERGWTMVEDAGRGYRRVVPSPVPTDIVEWPVIRRLVDAGVLVVACGGGGVPVVREDTRVRGVEAVIDKDLAAQLLATLLEADTLILLTEVDAVAINFGTPDQEILGTVTLDQMKKHIADGQFPPGSMGPKVHAAIRFIEAGGHRAVITSARHLSSAIAGHRGTQVLAPVPEAASAEAPA